jgi:hypothetical protein
MILGRVVWLLDSWSLVDSWLCGGCLILGSVVDICFILVLWYLHDSWLCDGWLILGHMVAG